MTISVLERPAPGREDSDGGIVARRAVVRWAWRLFRREWRQQLLILALIVLAVAATTVGAAVATNTPTPANTGFGTAQDLATFQGSNPHLAGDVASLQHRFGHVDIIENETLPIPGTVNTYQLRAQNPNGPFGGPMLSLAAGHYPATANQVALTSGLASELDLKLGDVWHESGAARRVVGIVENPQNLLDEFALVAPGQVTAPTQVTVLFDAPGVDPASIGPNVQTPSSAAGSSALDPETISIVGLTLGMLLIALVSVGGFTVLAQRRLRSLGMLASLGATDENVSLVVRANGILAGVVGASLGAALGLVAWFAYRPSLQTSAHHVIGVLSLPWLVVVLAMVLAVVATYLAASQPARSIARIPVMAALSGRPIPPKQVHRSAIPGLVFLVVAFILLSYSGTAHSAKPRIPELIFGLVALIPAVILLSPFCLAMLAKLGRRTPIAIRLALRDLSRFRARSGSALAAISIGILIAVIISVAAAARYGNVLDYAGPNLASNQLIVYTPNGNPNSAVPGPCGGYGPCHPSAASASAARNIATAVGSNDVVLLETTSASLQHAAPGRNWSGPLYVATPSLLRTFGIKPSEVDASADILTMRSGLTNLSLMQLIYGDYSTPGQQTSSFPCPKTDCLANPVIQHVNGLPSGTSAPNTLITEHAVRALGLQTAASGWLIQSAQLPNASQINSARLMAAGANMTIETKSSAASSAEIINVATIFGIVLALAILAMSIGLIRSETAGDLRTLAATGASTFTRRTIAAATASALGLLGGVLGTVAGYVGIIGWVRSNSLNGGLSALGNVPIGNLLFIVVGMPIVAGVAAWLLAGREPLAMGRQPIE